MYNRKHPPAEEIWIFHERVSFLSLQREHAQRPHAPPIYEWLADVQNSLTWLADDFLWYGLLGHNCLFNALFR